MLYLSHEFNCRFFQSLEEKTVAVIGIVVSEDDQAQFMAGVVKDLLLQGQFATLEGDLCPGGTVREGLVHGVPHIHY